MRLVDLRKNKIITKTQAGFRGDRQTINQVIFLENRNQNGCSQGADKVVRSDIPRLSESL